MTPSIYSFVVSEHALDSDYLDMVFVLSEEGCSVVAVTWFAK